MALVPRSETHRSGRLADRALLSSALDSLVGRAAKKPKMTTLQKSSLDWTQYKQATGIAAELEYHNKDGFLERRSFLQRAELHEWERDRALRMAPKPPPTR